jgi:solute carrier family 25 carnitine/acylcarnitine transporter 20/29
MANSTDTPSKGTLIVRKFVGGTLGGFLQSLCSHPFDTIKSRMQNGQASSIRACFSDMIRSEGVAGLYRGVTPPLAINGTYNAVLFGVNQFMTLLVTPKDHPTGTPLPLWRVALAAQMTAPFTVLVLTPVEVIKVKLQCQPKGADKLYSGPLDCGRKLVKQDGWMALMRGYAPTLGSRLVGLPFYFIGYELARRQLTASVPAGAPAPGYVPPCAGAVAGVTFWCACYPFDFTKTLVQATNRRAVDIASETYNTKGAIGFYKGFSACLLRAVPANASVWWGMEQTTQAMARNGW